MPHMAYTARMLQRTETRVINYLTVAEMSERTGIATRTIRGMALKGEIEGAQRIGGQWLLPESEADNLPRRERGWQVKKGKEQK